MDRFESNRMVESNRMAVGRLDLSSRTRALDGGTEDKEFLRSIMGDGKRIIYQLHSDPENVYRSAPLNGQRPPMGKILDRLSERIGRDLKSVYDYRDQGRCYKVSFANYVK